MAPTVAYEHELQAQGLAQIAGLDEAGRGCWAGPVVAAAAVLSPAVLADPGLLAGVDDSKQMSATLREQSYDQILAYTTTAGVGVVPAYLIDAYGIIAATRLAMTVALLSLRCVPDGLLIDALPLPQLAIPQTVLIRGDALSLSIAAASVLAKVTRDRLMQTASVALPGYGFALHKGYGTALHQQALHKHGPSSLHRHTFKPLIKLALQQEAHLLMVS